MDQPEGMYPRVAWLGDAEGEPVGSLGLWVEANPRRQHVASLGMAVHDRFAGRGSGRR